VLTEIHRQGVQPSLFGLEYSYDWLDSMPKVADSIDFFRTTAIRLAEESAVNAER